jgi:hypothetical protein
MCIQCSTGDVVVLAEALLSDAMKYSGMPSGDEMMAWYVATVTCSRTDAPG